MKIALLLLILLGAAVNTTAEETKIYSNDELKKYQTPQDEDEDQLRAQAIKKCKDKVLAAGSVFFKPNQISKVDIFSEISFEENKFEFLVSVIYHLPERNIDTQHFLNCSAKKQNSGEWTVATSETSKYGD